MENNTYTVKFENEGTVLSRAIKAPTPERAVEIATTLQSWRVRDAIKCGEYKTEVEQYFR